LQGVLDWLNIPYVGSSVGASAVGMNKVLFKNFIRGMGIATAPHISIEKGQIVPSFAQATKFLNSEKVVLKPVSSGASVGLKLINNSDQYKNHIDILLKEFGSCLVESFLSECREFSVGVHDFDGVVSSLPVCELHTGGEVFDFDMKNGFSFIDKTIPAQINSRISQDMQRIAAQIHSGLGAQGSSRIDMLLTQDLIINVLEINTLPGLMPQSVLPKSFEITGVSYDEMIEKMLIAAKKPKRFEVAKQYGQQPTLSDSVIASMNAIS
jgi:D-alanine-D-alanine ligase